MEKVTFKINENDLKSDYLYFNVMLKQTINNIGLYSDGELFSGEGEIIVNGFAIRNDIGFTSIQATCDEYNTNGFSGELWGITCDVFAVGHQMYHQGNPYIRTNINNYYLVHLSSLNRVFAISCTPNGIITEINEITNC